MEAQLAHEAAAELRAEVADLARAERATVTLVERMKAQGVSPLQLTVTDGSVVTGALIDVAQQWLLVAEHGRTGEVLVPTRAMTAVRGLSARAGEDAGAVTRRLGLGHALRAIARDRAAVELRTMSGTFTGTVDHVAADHLDLAEHAPDVIRRDRDVRGRLAVTFDGLLSIRRLTDPDRW